MDAPRKLSARKTADGGTDLLLGDLAEDALHHIGASAALAAQSILKLPGQRTDIHDAGGKGIVPAAFTPGNHQRAAAALGSLTGRRPELGDREKICPEDGEVICGLQPGTSLSQLKNACADGKAVEALLRHVRVMPGDVCYIPAGCVHAVGAGVMLYEIQESSDVTYRFYDWDREDAEGKKRELHIEKGLAVADLKCAQRPVRVSEAYGSRRLLNEERFTLDVIRCGGMEFLPDIGEFGILTVLQGELSLKWYSGEMKLSAGDTCLLPRSAPNMHLRGEGYAALAMPNG